MSAHDQMVEAQRLACELYAENMREEYPRPLTPDALAALLEEKTEWRECACGLVKAYFEGVEWEFCEALARFDALKAKHANPVAISGPSPNH